MREWAGLQDKTPDNSAATGACPALAQPARDLPRAVFWTMLVVVLGIAYGLLHDRSLYSDELWHYRLIMDFANDRVTPANLEMTATIPAYHALLALAAKVCGQYSYAFLRAVSLAVSLAAILAFWFAARSLGAPRPRLTTLQFSLLPMAWPYLTLIYTDLSVLAFMFLSLGLVARKKLVLAGLVATVGLCFRQNYVIWMGMIFAYAAWLEHGVAWDLGRAMAFGRKAWTFLLGFVAFVVFVVVNGGVSFGGATQHSMLAGQGGNVYYSLFVFTVVMLPLVLAQVPGTLAWVRRHPLAAALLATGFLGLYVATFKVDHYWNSPAMPVIRNALLHWATGSPGAMLLFGLPMAVALLTLAATKLRDAGAWLLYPTWVASLLPLHLIDSRYYLMPVAVWLLLRRHRDGLAAQLAQTGWLVLICAWVMWMCRERNWII